MDAYLTWTPLAALQTSFDPLLALDHTRHLLTTGAPLILQGCKCTLDVWPLLAMIAETTRSGPVSTLRGTTSCRRTSVQS